MVKDNISEFGWTLLNLPTLILHGRKGLRKRLEKAQEEAVHESDTAALESSEEQENSQPSLLGAKVDFSLPPCLAATSAKDDSSTVDDGGGSLKTQEFWKIPDHAD